MSHTASVEVETLLDAAYAYPDHAIYLCPVFSRQRLTGLLESGSDLAFCRDGLVMWIAIGSPENTVLYLSPDPMTLTKHLGDALAHFTPVARREGGQDAYVYANSPEATAAFAAQGFSNSGQLVVMAHAQPVACEPDVRMRRLAPEDAHALAPVAQRAFPKEDRSLERWEQVLGVGNDGWVVRHGDQCVGFVLYRPMARHLEITGLAVDPAFSGRGYGSALIRQVLDSAAREGFSSARVIADADPRTVALYDRNGFVRTDDASYMRRPWP